jgi:urease beta subunit
MRKIFLGLGIALIFLIVIGVFAAAADSAPGEENSSISGLANIKAATDKYIKDFVDKRGIKESDISNISEVDFDSLPKEVNIENVGDNNLAIYQVDYKDPDKNEDKNVFVVTYSVEKLKKQGDLIISHDQREILNFGFSGENSGTEFLKTATGVDSSAEKGYVMMRKGSITGISTNLDVLNSGDNEIKIVIYKNGEEINFGNSLAATEGIQKDYDTQSRDNIRFEPGDIISVELVADGNVAWKDAITMVEITVYD